MSKRKPSITMIPIRPADKLRVRKLADRGVRGLVDQLTVVIDRYCDAEGLDPKTLKGVHDESG